MPAEDVVAGCVRWLKADPAVAGSVAADAGGRPLIVQDSAPDRAEFTGAVCIVVAYQGPAAGNDHNTYEQVRLLIEFWSDAQRDADGNLEAPSAGRERMVSVYQAVDRRLHRPQGGVQQWGAIVTTDATRLAGLTPYLVPGSDGLWRGTAFYDVGLA
jgi:hypothetical protein